MFDLGSELRQAREQAGLTREEAAQRTRIQLAKIVALEENDLSRLPEGRYYEGLVRAYARELGADGNLLLLRQRVESSRRAHGKGPAAASSVRSPLPAEPPLRSPLANPPIGSPLTDPLIGPPLAEPPLRSTFADPPVGPTVAEPPLGLPAEPVDPPTSELPSPLPAERPSSGLSRAALGVILLVIALGASFALGFYLMSAASGGSGAETAVTADADATGSAPEGVKAAASAPQEADTTPPARPAEGAPSPETGAPPAQTRQEIPAERGETATARSEPSANATAARQERADAAPAAPPAPVPRPENSRTAAGAPADRASVPPPPSPSREAAPPAADLSGSWTLATEVEESSYRAYEGLRLEYRVELQQRGNTVVGSGHKVAENGRRTAGAGRTPIEIQGTIDGDRLTLTFTERGTRRASDGRFMLYVEDEGIMRGRFSSSAARSSGLVEARRDESGR